MSHTTNATQLLSFILVPVSYLVLSTSNDMVIQHNWHIKGVKRKRCGCYLTTSDRNHPRFIYYVYNIMIWLSVLYYNKMPHLLNWGVCGRYCAIVWSLSTYLSYDYIGIVSTPAPCNYLKRVGGARLLESCTSRIKTLGELHGRRGVVEPCNYIKEHFNGGI